MDLFGFIGAALPLDATKRWDANMLRSVAGLSPPNTLFGRREALIRGDAHQQWAQWFIQGIVDPLRYVESDRGYAHIFFDTLEAVNSAFQALTKDERVELAKLVANKVLESVLLLRSNRDRALIDRESRLLLLELAGDCPRCWVCGYPFSDRAIERFLHRNASERLLLPEFVDAMKPIGLTPSDVAIEIDHKHPFSRGGTDSIENLRLACGWCNRHKGASVSLYDEEGRVRTSQGHRHLFPSLPQPFWVVRVLATQKKCEHLAGCDRTSETSELTVAPAYGNGAPTPTNLRVTCHEHDPLRLVRMVPRTIASQIWGKSPRSVKEMGASG
ncbi:HNH endonuclease [Trinickia caryophylli]|jgi:5-methylcytosine-specific restriction endonuclease McrA|nr:HNH endonuclease [Trinickia caryophylli]TRX19091.1 HNH endonuclease [Trinickia caryophylli]